MVSQPDEADHDHVDHSAQQESFIGEWSGDESDTTEEESAPPPPKRSQDKRHRGKAEKDQNSASQQQVVRRQVPFTSPVLAFT